MPLLDSFTVDHTRMNAPAVRVAKTMQTPKGDTITVFDLRFTAPNKDILSEKGINTCWWMSTKIPIPANTNLLSC